MPRSVSDGSQQPPMKEALTQLIQCHQTQIHTEAEAELHLSNNDDSAALLASMPRTMSDVAASVSSLRAQEQPMDELLR